MWVVTKLWGSKTSALLCTELSIFPKELTVFINFRNLSEPVMTYRLHKELVSAASKYFCYQLIVLS